MRIGERVRVVRDSLADVDYDWSGRTGMIVAAPEAAGWLVDYTVVVRLEPEDGPVIRFRPDELVVINADE